MVNPNQNLIIISLRGGCDGLNLVGPSADPIYISERKVESRVERTGNTPGLVLANTLADVDFRFHHKATDLKNLYDSKQLSIIHASGLTNKTRSHFEAIDYIERGTPSNKNTPTGWLTRFSTELNLSKNTSVVSTGTNLPTSLLGSKLAISVPDIGKIQLKGDSKVTAIRANVLKQLYNGTSQLSVNGLNTLNLVDFIGTHITKDPNGTLRQYIPSTKANYPDGQATGLSNSLKTMAQLIKMDIGVRIGNVDFGGWDTHFAQQGRFINLVDALSLALGAFWRDIEGFQDRTTVVVMSEFGRRLKSNDSGGTDHGHAGAMMVLGAGVKGGNIYGTWPGLATNQLDNQVDLAVTTDYRHVFGEIISKRFTGINMNNLFPAIDAYSNLGFISA